MAELEPCPFCLEQTPATVSRCRHCGAELTPPPAPPGLIGLWLLGGFLLVVGVAIASSSDDARAAGIIVGSVGGVMLQIATIATGVSIGMRARDWKAFRNRYDSADKMTT